MPLEITFTLSDRDLEQLREIVIEARERKQEKKTPEEIEVAARALIQEAQKDELPEFVLARMKKLDVVMDMINDEEWQLEDAERHQVFGALSYLCDPEGLIPDHIPGLGFLDDAIYVEVVVRELHNEISLYEEFCEFRHAEEAKRETRGENIKVGREEWLAEKRVALHAAMRKRRSLAEVTGEWRSRLWD
jgi:uncharacterized membrane protein YkvA (DUF1232 family)